MNAERLMEFYLEWVIALPLSLTEDSPRRWLRLLGFIAIFPWFLLLAMFGPLTLGTMVVLVLFCCIEAVWAKGPKP